MKKFSKKVEDFICENCGLLVKGNGFTNHCPHCFYSKHVDINPGDRACNCGGLMKPIDILQKNGRFFIQHKCEKCGFIRNNALREEEQGENFIKLMKKLATEKNFF